MEIYTSGARVQVHDSRGQSTALACGARPALAQWLTAQEVEALREALVRGCLPPDFQRKLGALGAGDLSDRFIEQNCRLFAALLLATEEGSFRPGRAERDRLLRVLAYVRKEQDAIPDYLPGGLQDDQREVRAATIELSELLQVFKAWRLRHQVPGMWHSYRVNA